MGRLESNPPNVDVDDAAFAELKGLNSDWGNRPCCFSGFFWRRLPATASLGLDHYIRLVQMRRPPSCSEPHRDVTMSITKPCSNNLPTDAV